MDGADSRTYVSVKVKGKMQKTERFKQSQRVQRDGGKEVLEEPQLKLICMKKAKGNLLFYEVDKNKLFQK